MTFTVVIGVGVTERVLGSELQHAVDPSHVGRAEAERLMGAAREHGLGPLPTFLRGVEAAQRAGAPLGMVLLCDGTPGGVGENPVPLAAPFASLAVGAEIVTVTHPHVPWPALRDAVRRLSGTDPLDRHATEALRFFLVGCHTEQQILALALVLRSNIGLTRIAVSPHLVGSATSEAHLAVLRHNLPRAGVEVHLDLRQSAEFVGIDAHPLDSFGCTACALEPAALRDTFDVTARQIIELLCLHWTRARLRPLGGGFSGSLLLLASGWKGDATTEPMVIKVDRYPLMRREIDGYHLVKDLLGKHVPTFAHPVASNGYLGVGMDLAAMEGSPTSLQDSYELAETEADLDRYLRRLDKALALLSERLYRNTRRLDWFSPYRIFHLHTDMQMQWLAENMSAIERYWRSDTGESFPVDHGMLAALLHQVGRNEDGVEGEVCLAHGDLNFKNIICDDGDNVWFIDWTHSGRLPVEIDFAKMENDVKFVMSKQFDLDDLPRLRRLEDYLLSQPLPGSVDQLPDTLRFVRWDLRFRKVLLSVRRIRETCFALKQSERWLVYRIALLKYGLHSLSFDRRRGLGECDLPQLMHAAHSVDGLLNDLMVDEFQLRIRGERPPSYPPRQRVSIDYAPWAVPCREYDPPYHVEPDVIANDCTRIAGGWADPEDITRAVLDTATARSLRDREGRPLHPHGRTGIAGRGALGRWGPNLSVVAVITRQRTANAGIDVLLGSREKENTLLPPQGFVRHDETTDAAVTRVLENETGWHPVRTPALLSDGYGYDPRQTDHAWVVVNARHLHLSSAEGPAVFRPGGQFDEVSWYPLEAATINRIPAGPTRHVRDVIRALEASGTLTHTDAAAVLAATG